MHRTPHTIDITPQGVEYHRRRNVGVVVALVLVLGLVLVNLALWPGLRAASRLPLQGMTADLAAWSPDAPRATYKPGAPNKVLLMDDSYRQIRSDVENFTQSVAEIRQGIRQQIALSDVLLALKSNNPDITPAQAQQMLLNAGYDIPTPEVIEALKPDASRFMKDDNASRARFAQEIAQEIIKDKISGLLKNIELITRVGQYVLVSSPEK